MKEFAQSLEGAAARAFDEAALAPVRQLNAYALDTLAGCARHPAWAGGSWEAALGPRFSQLVPEFRAELARSPVALIEFAASLCDPDAASVSAPPAFLSATKALELSQITLSLAWTFSRQDSAAAKLVFGLTAAEVHRIRNVDVRDIPRLAERRAGSLRPRWLDRPRIWQGLLHRPYGPWVFRTGPAYLRILQRQFADCRLATPTTRLTRRSCP